MNMEPLIRLVGLKGCSGDTYAYFSRDKENVKKALELGIACTGADDNGAYNIYFNDSALRTTPKLFKCLSSFTSR